MTNGDNNRGLWVFGDSNAEGFVYGDDSPECVALNRWPQLVANVANLVLGGFQKGGFGLTTENVFGVGMNGQEGTSAMSIVPAICQQAERPPTYAVIALGTNDALLSHETDRALYQEIMHYGMATVLDALQYIGTGKLVVASPIQCSSPLVDSTLISTRLSATTEAFAAVAKDKRATFLDMSDVIPGPDGIHLDRTGHVLYAHRVLSLQ